jgi:H+/gluconate symporter-like permease
MQERICLAQRLFHIGLFVMLGAAIVSATLGSADRSGVVACFTGGGAVLALVARIWLSQLQRSSHQHNAHPGVWAAR